MIQVSILPVALTLLICGAVPDEEYVDITWNIAFSGRTPDKILLADTLSGSAPEYNMTDTETNRLITHSNVEISR